jgi:hypothetical protein
MVKHIVMWRLKDGKEEGNKKENARKVKQMLEQTAAHSPC